MNNSKKIEDIEFLTPQEVFDLIFEENQQRILEQRDNFLRDNANEAKNLRGIGGNIVYKWTPLWKSIIILKTIFSPEFLQATNLQTQFLVSKHRFTARKNIHTFSNQYITSISILPFVAALGIALHDKYKSDLGFVFFQRTLPGLSGPALRMNWETTHYVLPKENRVYPLGSPIRSYDNTLLLSFSAPTNPFFTRQYIGIIDLQKNQLQTNEPLEIGEDNPSRPTKASLTEQIPSEIGSNRLTIPSELIEPLQFQTMHLYFDDFPLKIESNVKRNIKSNVKSNVETIVPKTFKSEESKNRFKENLYEQDLELNEIHQRFNQFVYASQQLEHGIQQLFQKEGYYPIPDNLNLNDNQVSPNTTIDTVETQTADLASPPSVPFTEQNKQSKKNVNPLIGETSIFEADFEQKNLQLDGRKLVKKENTIFAFPERTTFSHLYGLNIDSQSPIQNGPVKSLEETSSNTDTDADSPPKKLLYHTLIETGFLKKEQKPTSKEQKPTSKEKKPTISPPNKQNNSDKFASKPELKNELTQYLGSQVSALQTPLAIEQIPLEYPVSRLMSGYTHPDMNSNEIQKFLVSRLTSSLTPWSSPSTQLVIPLPASFTFVNTDGLTPSSPPKYSVRRQHITLRDTSRMNRPIKYAGSAICVNPELGLDWDRLGDVQLKNLGEFYSWLEGQLSPYTVGRFQKIDFFGEFESPEADGELQIDEESESSSESTSESKNPETFLDAEPESESTSESKNSETSEKFYWVSNLPTLVDYELDDPDPLMFATKPEALLPPVSQQEWDIEIEKARLLREEIKRQKKAAKLAQNPELQNEKDENDSSDDEDVKKIEPILPFIEVPTLKNSTPQLDFHLDSRVDYSFSPSLGNLPKRAFEIPPYNQAVSKSLTAPLSSGRYQGKTSLFSQTWWETPWQFIWEPLSLDSWLLVSQIGFATLVFTIVKETSANYGRELLGYLLDLVKLLGFVDDNIKKEIEILIGNREKGFRIIPRTPKNFENIAGIKPLLPKVVEIVWYLRNGGRDFGMTANIPRGVLLSGPPGTGKTLLVQAIAGEAEVPVLATSGSSLVAPGESGAIKLELLFEEARRMAPCIVFIDEIDSIAEKREGMVQRLISRVKTTTAPDEFPLDPRERGQSLAHTINKYPIDEDEEILRHENMLQQVYSRQNLRREKLRMLLQLLVELDGMQKRHGVIVFAATNRPEVLDTALFRPGRIDRTIKLGLPDEEKRREIIELYGKKLGFENSIPWEYILKRTGSYSAADLAGIMNQSSLRAILLRSQHSVITIEEGIDRITSVVEDRPAGTKTPELEMYRLAYYQAGKVLVSMLLEHHPPMVVAHLWPRRTNVRAIRIGEHIQRYILARSRRVEMEHRLIGSYAGKAAEILFLQHSPDRNGFYMNLSDLGHDDLAFAQKLIFLMVEKWHLYSGTPLTYEYNEILEGRYSQEYKRKREKILLFKKFLQNLDEAPTEKKWLQKRPGGEKFKKPGTFELQIPQEKLFTSPWWQKEVSDQLQYNLPSFSQWYRLYLPIKQEIVTNLLWIPPDQHFQQKSRLAPLGNSRIRWNQLPSVHREYQVHSLMLDCYNEALQLLDQNRELLDKLAYELIQREILRLPEIENICSEFGLRYLPSPRYDINWERQADISTTKPSGTAINLQPDNIMPEIRIVQSSWGENSRRPLPRWINQTLLKKFLTDGVKEFAEEPKKLPKTAEKKTDINFLKAEEPISDSD
jgi:ATP-dependent Zn protease